MNKICHKTITFFLILLISVPSSLFLFGCKNDNEGFVFGTYYSTEISGTNSKKINQDLAKFLNELDAILAYDINDSDLNKINNAKAEQDINISTNTYKLIKIAMEYNKKFVEFNPSLYPLVELWGFSPNKYKLIDFSVPNDQLIAEKLKYCSMEYFSLNPNKQSVSKKFDNTKIDFGAYAKGYAVDLLYDLSLAKHAKNAIINIGGTIKTSTNININIEDPRISNYAAEFTLNSGEAVATSGDYQRYYMLENTRYSHIIRNNGQATISTGTSPISVSIVGEKALLCDILSTYIFIVGLTEESKNVLKEFNYSALIITESGHMKYGNKEFNILNNTYN